jgi:hypothetical protein
MTNYLLILLLISHTSSLISMMETKIAQNISAENKEKESKARAFPNVKKINDNLYVGKVSDNFYLAMERITPDETMQKYKLPGVAA